MANENEEFEKAVGAMTVGETKTFSIKFPDDYFANLKD